MRFFFVAALVIFASCTVVDQSDNNLKPQVLDSIEKAVKFLCERQSPKGSWHAETEGHIGLGKGPGISSLVLYALASTPSKIECKDNVEQAIKYLQGTQDKDGALGIISEDNWDYPNYATALTILALCEFKPDGWQETIKPLVQYLIHAQLDEDWGYDKHDKRYGGWDCGKPREGLPGLHLDISSTSYVLDALHFAGVAKNEGVFEKALVYVRRCQNLNEEGRSTNPCEDGGFKFTPTRSKGNAVEYKNRWYFPSYGSATCDGLISLLDCGLSRDDARFQAGLNWLKKNFELERNPGIQPGSPGDFDRGVYYYYLFSLANLIDKLEIKEWSAQVAKKLMELQKPDGSWINPIDSMKEADPLVATGFALLALNKLYPWIK